MKTLKNVLFLLKQNNKMKRLIFILIIIVTLFAGCIKNYDDGPFISFRSTSKLLLKKWRVEQFLVNSVDSTKLYNDSCGCDLIFENSEDNPALRLINCDNVLEDGLVSRFNYNKKRIQFNHLIILNHISVFSNTECQFKRLSKEDCWIESVINGKNYFLKLKAI